MYMMPCVIILDDIFKEHNYCDFIDGRCIAIRNDLGNQLFTMPSETVGCCFTREPGTIRDLKVCDHLCDGSCKTKCISCKLYTCDYLKYKGIGFCLSNFPCLGRVFNKKQLDVFIANTFRTREAIISKLLEVEKNRLPLFLFRYLRKSRVN